MAVARLSNSCNLSIRYSRWALLSTGTGLLPMWAPFGKETHVNPRSLKQNITAHIPTKENGHWVAKESENYFSIARSGGESWEHLSWRKGELRNPVAPWLPQSDYFLSPNVRVSIETHPKDRPGTLRPLTISVSLKQNQQNTLVIVGVEERGGKPWSYPLFLFALPNEGLVWEKLMRKR